MMAGFIGRRLNQPAAGGAMRSCIQRERKVGCERDGWVGDEADPVASIAAMWEERRGGPAARWEEGGEAIGGGDLGETRGIEGSISGASLSPFLFYFFIFFHICPTVGSRARILQRISATYNMRIYYEFYNV